MDKKSLIIVLLVISILFLVVSVMMVYSFTSLGSHFNIKKASLSPTPAGQVQIFNEGNEFSEVGK